MTTSAPRPPLSSVPRVDDTDSRTPIPTWLVALACTALLTGGGAWLTVVQADLRDSRAMTEALAARVVALERDASAKDAKLDAIDKTLVRMDGRLDKIDAHLEHLEQATAATPQRTRP